MTRLLSARDRWTDAALHLASATETTHLEADAHFIGGRLAGRGMEINGWKFRLEHGVHGIWSPYATCRLCWHVTTCARF